MKRIVSAIVSGLPDKALSILKEQDGFLTKKEVTHLLNISYKSDNAQIFEWILYRSKHRFELRTQEYIGNAFKHIYERNKSSPKILKVLMQDDMLDFDNLIKPAIKKITSEGIMENLEIILSDERVMNLHIKVSIIELKLDNLNLQILNSLLENKKTRSKINIPNMMDRVFRYGSEELIKICMKYCKSFEMDNALYSMCERGFTDIAKMLLSDDAFPTLSGVKNDMLHRACLREDIVAVKNLLDNRRTYEIHNNEDV